MDERLILTSAKRRLELQMKHFPKGVTPAEIKLLDDMQEMLSRAYQAGMQATERARSQEWSNQSCFGYMIAAAQHIGLDENEINRLTRAMHSSHDEMTVDEAAEHYRRSPY